jgi:hypothetical protein
MISQRIFVGVFLVRLPSGTMTGPKSAILSLAPPHLLRPAKMSSISTALINTRLQPGGGGVPAGEPFQRLAGAGETVETVLNCLADRHRAEARCL